MIRGYFGGPRGRRRPYVVGRVTVAQAVTAVDEHFLIDTGADVTMVAPRDTASLRLDLRPFARSRSTGIGGTTETVIVPADLTLDSRILRIDLRVLVPRPRAHGTVHEALPSLLDRDVLGQFGLYIEERRNLVLLLEPDEADAPDLA